MKLKILWGENLLFFLVGGGEGGGEGGVFMEDFTLILLFPPN